MHSSGTEITTDPLGLVPVAVRTLQSQKEISFDLYFWPAKNKPPRLYREKNVTLEPGDLQRLLDQSVTTLYTRSSEAQQYCDHVRSHVLADETIPAKDRYCILKDAANTILTASLERGDVDAVVKVTTDLGGDMVNLICNRKNIFQDLIAVMTHDYYTFTHLTNVCACSIVLAEAYGIHDRRQLLEIARGALLHDVGKCCIPAKVLNKTTKLSNDEQELIRRHPQRGFEELCLRTDSVGDSL